MDPEEGINKMTYENVWSSDKIVSSPLPDVEIPDITVLDFVWQNLDKWSDRTATICAVTSRSYKYIEIYNHSQAFGANLRSKFGINDDDVIAVILPNIPEYPTVVLGVLAAGGVVSTFNPIYTAFEFQKQIALSESKLVITYPDIVSIVREAFKLNEIELPIISVDTDKAAPEGTASYKELCEDTRDLNVLKDFKRFASDIALLPYSSGTTGLPKGVQLTNRNVVANFAQLNANGVRQVFETTETHQDVVPVVLPLFHVYGLTMIMLHKLANGVKLVMLPRFNPDNYLNALIDHRANLLYLAPPIVLFLGSSPQVTMKHFEHVRWIVVGAAPSPEADIQRVFEKAGRELQFCQGYGLTETSPVVTLGLYGFKNYKSVGPALPNVKLRIVDEKMKNLGPGEVGELLIKGPNVMKGYKNNPQANEEIFVEDGWLRSGDLASIDETGAVTIADRIKELIKVKGFQVPPAEIEGVIKGHPAVHDVAVVGFPDPALGEIPKAFVVLNEGHKPDTIDIIDFVAQRVAPYKKIKQVIFLESIPKNPAGKILRRVLKNMYT